MKTELQFETVLVDTDKKVKVVIDEFVQYDLMSDSDTGYTNYRVFSNDIDITNNLLIDEEIQLASETYEYCVDQIGITDDEEIEELNFE